MTYVLTLALPAVNTGANPTAADIYLTNEYELFQDKDTEKRKKPVFIRLFPWYTIRGSNPGHPD